LNYCQPDRHVVCSSSSFQLRCANEHTATVNNNNKVAEVGNASRCHGCAALGLARLQCGSDAPVPATKEEEQAAADAGDRQRN